MKITNNIKINTHTELVIKITSVIQVITQITAAK